MNALSGECELDRKYRILRDHPVGRGMPQERLELFAYLTKLTRYQDGEYVLRQGEIGERAFILIEGSAEALRESRGRVHRLLTLSVGDAFGELALVVAKPRPYTVRAVGPAAMLTLDRTGYRKAIERFPESALSSVEKIVARDADFMNLLLAKALECAMPEAAT